MEQVTKTESPKQQNSSINRSDRLVAETLEAAFSPAIIQETAGGDTIEVPAASIEALASQPPPGLDTQQSEEINLEMAAVEKHIDVLKTEMEVIEQHNNTKQDDKKQELHHDIVE